jgi:hypothetical protein
LRTAAGGRATHHCIERQGGGGVDVEIRRQNDIECYRCRIRSGIVSGKFDLEISVRSDWIGAAGRRAHEWLVRLVGAVKNVLSREESMVSLHSDRRRNDLDPVCGGGVTLKIEGNDGRLETIVQRRILADQAKCDCCGPPLWIERIVYPAAGRRRGGKAAGLRLSDRTPAKDREKRQEEAFQG